MAKSKTNRNETKSTEKENKKGVPGQEKNAPESPESGKNLGAWILAIVLGAIIILSLGYGYNTVMQKNIMKKACSDLSSSPDFRYPTVCVPFYDDSNTGDYVDQTTKPECKCKVDYGNGTIQIIDVRRVK